MFGPYLSSHSPSYRDLTHSVIKTLPSEGSPHSLSELTGDTAQIPWLPLLIKLSRTHGLKCLEFLPKTGHNLESGLLLSTFNPTHPRLTNFS